MNFGLSPNELTILADQLVAQILPRVNAAIQQASKGSQHSLTQLTVEDVAAQLKLSEKTIHKYLKERRLGGSNLGTFEKPVWRISQQAVQEFLKC